MDSGRDLNNWMALRAGRWALLCAGVCLMLTAAARAQVVPAGDKGGLFISAGGEGTGETLQYGDRKMTALTAFVDVDTRRRLGVEFEGRWLEWRQTANVHAETYSVGGRYHFDFGRRFQPYVKGLAGFGNFSYPYGLGTGRYLVITGGGGLDYFVNRRFTLRAADFEYQDWPQFNFGNMTTASVSVGLRVHVF